MKVVELGGGENPRYRPNVDVRPLPTVDIVADFETSPLPLPSDEYDLVYSAYVLEHISWRKVKEFIKEILRILKPGGKAKIITANLLEQCKLVIATKEWSEDISCTIFGGQEHEYGFHKCGFSPEYAQRLFKELGFSIVVVRPHPNCATDMIIEAFKPTQVTRKSWILSKCKVGEKILDVGSADGWIFRGSRFEPYVTSIDLDVYDLPNFIQMDAHDLIDPSKSFPDQSFDVAVLGDLLEHVEDPVKVLKGAKRVARRLLITIPDPANWIPEYRPFENLEQLLRRTGKTIEELAKESNPHAKLLCAKDGYKHLFHRRWYNKEMLEQQLKEAGIQDYNIENLMYDGWAFFVVEAFSETTLQHQQPIYYTQTTKRKTKKKRLKIALVSTPFLTTPPRTYGGLEQIVADLGECLAQKHDVTIFAADGSKVKGCEVIPCGKATETTQVNWLQAEKAMYEVYKDQLKDFDIVHGHNWFGFEYAVKAKNPHLKVCHTHHGRIALEWWSRSPPPFKLNLIAISKWMQNVYKAQGFNCQYVYNGINLSKFPLKRNKSNYLLFVGRIDKFKQPHLAIDVANVLNIDLCIIGGTFVQDAQYLEQIRSMCDGVRIKFYPDAPHKVKVKLMQNAKCLLFPSAMGEPFGLVACESMATGTPVVALNDGAIEEIVQEGGIICDVFDKQITPKGAVYNIKSNPLEALVEAVGKVDSIKPEDCRRNAERFSREAMASSYEKLYRQILDENEW
ncbi:MAG: glycosyltransferase [Candidatus Bathyarchaeota archaeon]|nr:glycosyltransferase [Candidatus Bathyarchaeota archaeon]